MIEALWVHQWHNVVNETLLRGCFARPTPHARAAATRVLCYWRDRVSDALATVRGRRPTTKIRACGSKRSGRPAFSRSPRQPKPRLATLKQPMDYYLDYTLNETHAAARNLLEQAMQEGKTIRRRQSEPASITGSLATSAFLNWIKCRERRRSPIGAALRGPTAGREVSPEARAGRVGKTSGTPRRVDEWLKPSDDAARRAASLAHLAPEPADDVQFRVKQGGSRCFRSQPPFTRADRVTSFAWAARPTIGGYDRVWTDASKRPGALADLAPPWRSFSIRAAQQGYAQGRTAAAPAPRGSRRQGRKRRRDVTSESSCRGPATLSLAEVEVLSDGRNMARNGKASQSSTEYGGCRLARDRRTSDGSYSDGGHDSHRRE